MVGKPYFHRAANRWYLRRGSRREIMSRDLEPIAKEIAGASERSNTSEGLNPLFIDMKMVSQ